MGPQLKCGSDVIGPASKPKLDPTTLYSYTNPDPLGLKNFDPDSYA